MSMHKNKPALFAVVLLGVFLLGLGFRSFPRAEAQVGTGASATETATSDLKKRVETFFSELDVSPSGSATGSSTAFEKLLRRGPLGGPGANESVTALKSRFETVVKQLGPYASCEFIDEKSVGSDLVILRYLYKCEKYPIVWYFTFYRSPVAPSEWFVIDVRFDTNLTALML